MEDGLFDKGPVFTKMWNKSLRIVNNNKIFKKRHLNKKDTVKYGIKDKTWCTCVCHLPSMELAGLKVVLGVS